MPTPYTPLKIATFSWFVMAVVTMIVGYALSQGGMWILGFPLAVYGFLQAITHFGRLIRIYATEALLLDSSDEELRAEYRETLPRQIFQLLFAVAEVDGSAAGRQRRLIRDFVLARFPDPLVHRDFMTWNAERIPPKQIAPLVHHLRAQLTRAECETLFHWCCQITLADDRFSGEEHEMLQQVSEHLGFAKHHARRIFLHAKHRVLGTEYREYRGQSSSRHARQATTVSPRTRALEILGLPPNATEQDIRKRHRELVKRYHPDAHGHLGEVAKKEATDRFREVQEAYETLTT